MKRATLALIAAALALPAHAQDRRPQYRILALADGREITAEILSTEAEGLAVRTTQGETLIAFDQLKDMSPVDKSTYELGESWFVFLSAPEPLQPILVEGFGWVDGLNIQWADSEFTRGVSPDAAEAAKACQGDSGCLLDAMSDENWMWVVRVEPQEGGAGLQAFGGINTGSTRTRVSTPGQERQDIWTLVHEVLDLDVPDSGPPKQRDARPPRPAEPVTSAPRQSDLNMTALTLTPLPGLPAMKQGNGGRAATAWLIAGAGTAAFVGAAGSSAQSAPELAAFGAVGWYASTVFANHVTASRP